LPWLDTDLILQMSEYVLSEPSLEYLQTSIYLLIKNRQ
jgi:hypothetical protein